MVIKDYKFDGTFFVEYIPKDPNLSPYTYGVTLPYHESPTPSKEEVISRLAGGSPQDFWIYEIESMNFDETERKSLIGLEFDNAQELMPEKMA
jgi:hypothetical protein